MVSSRSLTACDCDCAEVPPLEDDDEAGAEGSTAGAVETAGVGAAGVTTEADAGGMES